MATRGQQSSYSKTSLKMQCQTSLALSLWSGWGRGHLLPKSCGVILSMKVQGLVSAPWLEQSALAAPKVLPGGNLVGAYNRPFEGGCSKEGL